MNIIKETLEKTFDELSNQISHQEVLRKTHLTNKANQIVASIDESFKEFHLTITDTDIQFKLVEDSWYDFRVSRSTKYTAEGYTYSKATLSTSSVSDASTNGLKKLVCLGILAQHCLSETNKWNELVSLMDETNEIYKANIGPLYKQFYQIESELRKIKQEEQTNEFQNVFNKGTFKLTKQEYFYYGNGKWDRIYSNEFFWEANESGKTYTMFYINESRTNPFYDENGKELEGVFEKTKRSINKRIRKADVESFVRYNMNKILVEEAV